jgi:hypothetical protein
MKNRTDTFEYHGRTFEVVTVMEAGFHGAMASAHIYEVVRPSWKFFRTRWLDTKSFWVDDFDTIAEGVETMLRRLLEKEYSDKETMKKWENFVNEEKFSS